MNEIQTKYVVLGSGAAGVTAAAAIRERDPEGRIVLVSGEKEMTYKRPMLSKTPLRSLRRACVALHEDNWYGEQRIALLLGRQVLALDAAQKTVTLEDGAIRYEKCVYALGGTNFVPPFKGVELPGVLTVRTLEDVRRMKRSAIGSDRAVIIGGGVIGLEIALELARYGMEVTVLEALPRLMPRQLDPDTSARLQTLLTGLHIHTGVTVEEIGGDGQAQWVRLADGRVFPCGLVMVSCGQKANVAVAQAAALRCGRAVIVNARMETSAPDIWACGDCAEYEGVNVALWSQAVAEGMVAGANAAGGAETLSPFDASLILNSEIMSLFALGDLGQNPEKTYECDVTERRFDEFSINARLPFAVEKRFYSGGRLVGGCILGNLSG
ncbi:MAG TPA: FAD-dependent oxidoreductase, partial [Terriglobales bacterium]|nr:FAD-dependent oxidoreductase [Terriglobales bacterium]